MKTRFSIILLLTTALTLLLIACSSQSSTTEDELEDTNSNIGRHRIVVDHKGEQTLPEHPERIAVTYFSLTELLLSFNHPPVGANYFDDFVANFKALQPYYQGTEIVDIGSYNEINLEKLLDLNPDLILAAGSDGDASGNDQIYTQLTQIAPVFFIDSLKANDDWQWALLEIGRALNLEKDAEEIIAQYQNNLNDAKDQLSDSNEQTVLFVDVQDNGFYLWGTERLHYYNDLELTTPEPFDGTSQEISLEGISSLNPDHIFIHNRSDVELEPRLKELENSTVWNHIQAVQNNHIHLLESSAFSPGPIGITYGIETIINALNH
ncbi:iron-siderophore ABC transporter substrate-binding protein [Halalkalibacter sp. AB-rgal2]|uniref:iron-siderophore ABC transporter substrate-binding protein n=1 Tax=Halalkalibacter sp. AB-rgal2 TaxID=3242695 RepID=UPI00359E1874